MPTYDYKNLKDDDNCRRNMVGSLPRGMPTVVDESVEVRVIGTGWWHKRRDSDLDRFRPSDQRNTLRPMSMVYYIIYEVRYII